MAEASFAEKLTGLMTDAEQQKRAMLEKWVLSALAGQPRRLPSGIVHVRTQIRPNPCLRPFLFPFVAGPAQMEASIPSSFTVQDVILGVNALDPRIAIKEGWTEGSGLEYGGGEKVLDLYYGEQRDHAEFLASIRRAVSR